MESPRNGYRVNQTPLHECPSSSKAIGAACRVSTTSTGDGGALYNRKSQAYAKEAQKEADDLEEEIKIESQINIIKRGLDYPQLTFKSLFVGAICGVFISVLAMYYGLKTGVVPSLNVLAGLGGFIIVNALTKVGIFKEVFTVQENVVIQTCAVACYSLSSQAGFTSGFLALTSNVYKKIGVDTPYNLPIDVIEITWVRAFTWCVSIALFGFFVAFPLRDNMIIKNRLLYPSGTATASLIETLHTSKEAAARQWNVLWKSGVVSYFWSLFLWFFKNSTDFPIFGLKAAKFGWMFDWSTGTYGIGLMLSFRIIYSMLIGCLITNLFINPYIDAYKKGTGPEHWFTPKQKNMDGYKAYYTFSAIAAITVDAIYSIVKIGWLMYKSYRDSKNPQNKGNKGEELSSKQLEKQNLLDKIFVSAEIPSWLWIAGLVFFGALSVVVIHFAFDRVVWYKVLVSCLLIPFFAVGIIQGVGLTDWNISSSIGKLVMFIIGSWSGPEKSITASLLMCQCVVVGCSQAADLMQDFKTGYLVGASPRAMIVAQLFGALMSCVIVPSVWVLMNSAYDIPGDVIQAPYGELYRSIAIIAVNGFSGLPKYCGYFMLAFGLGDLLLQLFIDFFSESRFRVINILANYAPLPLGIAIGMIVPAPFSLQAFIVGLVCLIWKRNNSEQFYALRYVLAAGLLCGEGFKVLTEIFISIGGGHPPVAINYAVYDPSAE